jgi:hypothetical protein
VADVVESAAALPALPDEARGTATALETAWALPAELPGLPTSDVGAEYRPAALNGTTMTAAAVIAVAIASRHGLDCLPSLGWSGLVTVAPKSRPGFVRTRSVQTSSEPPAHGNRRIHETLPRELAI